MAICEWCKQEMSGDHPADTCTGNVVTIGDEDFDPVPYDPDYGGPDQRCHDCNIKRGGAHHPGCDMERCPVCRGQLIGCGCLDEEEDEGDDDPEDE